MIKYFLEIKNRFFLLLLTWLSTFIVSYAYKETLLFLIVNPDKFINSNTNSPMFYFIFTNVTEIFTVYIELISFLTGQIIIFYIVYHCFIFLTPALFKKEYTLLYLLIKIIVFVWLFSIFISNNLVIPLTWSFFYSFHDLISAKFMTLHFEAKINEYLEFYILMYYLCVVYCQIFTIFFFFLSYVNNKSKIIKKFRKLYYYFFVVFSALISPPDIFSQIGISLSVILFYEILAFSFLTKTFLTR